MHESIRFGRIAGIAVGINWSVLVIAALVTWGLADETLPTSYPGHPPAAYWSVATVASVVFFASLLAHELGHSIVARRHGVNVEAITLWMLGGVSKLEGGATNARDELRIAAVGPAVSIALSVVFGFVAVALDLVGAPELLVAAFGWLATITSSSPSSTSCPPSRSTAAASSAPCSGVPGTTSCEPPAPRRPRAGCSGT